MNLSGELQGADEMTVALAKLETNVAKKHVRQALRAGARVIQRELVATADSPELAAAVKVRAGKRSRDGMSVMVTLSGQTLHGGKSNKVFWAGFYNYGHRIGRRLKTKAAAILAKLKLRKSDVGLSENRGTVHGTHGLDHGFDDSSPMAQQVVIETLQAGLNEEIANSTALKAGAGGGGGGGG